jgi:hypothetical protein
MDRDMQGIPTMTPRFHVECRQSFPAYLNARPDGCFETADFLSQGPTAARHRRLDEFISKKGIFAVGAGDLVFQATSLVRSTTEKATTTSCPIPI